MADKTVVLLSLLVITIGVVLYYYLAVYKAETENPYTVEEESRQSEDEHISQNENDIKEQMHHTNVLKSQSGVSAEVEEKGDHTHETVQDDKSDTVNNKKGALLSESSDETRASCFEDLHSLKDQVKHLLEKQTNTETSTTNKLEMENAVEKLKTELHNNVKLTEVILNEIKNKTDMKFANLSKILENVDNDSKVVLKELQISLSSLANETKGNVSQLNQSMTVFYAKVEGDFKAKLQDFDDQLKAIQNDKESADKRIIDLQQLLYNRIFPNTFNKDIAVIVFLVVVAFVLFLTFCIYSLRSALGEARLDIASLRKELETLKQGQTDSIVRNEVPGRM